MQAIITSDDRPWDYGPDTTPFSATWQHQRYTPPEIRIPIFNERRSASFLLAPHYTQDSEGLGHSLDSFTARGVQDQPTNHHDMDYLQKEDELIEGARADQVSNALPTPPRSTRRPFNDMPLQRPHSPTPRTQAPILERRLARMGRSLEASQTDVVVNAISFAAQSVRDEITRCDYKMPYQSEEEHADIVRTSSPSEFQPFWQGERVSTSAFQPRTASTQHWPSRTESTHDSRAFFYPYSQDRIAENDHEMQREEAYHENIDNHESSEYHFFKVLPTPLSDAVHPPNASLSPQSNSGIRTSAFEEDMSSNSCKSPSFLHPSAIQLETTPDDNNYVIADPLEEELPEDFHRNEQVILLDPMVNASDFVKKLFNALEDPRLQSVMCWGPLGDRFWITNVKEYTKTILPRLYKHSNFASFVRQLNKYGFHKVKNTSSDESGAQTWCFRHPNFHSRKPEELENIKPKRSVSQRNIGEMQIDAGMGSSSGSFHSTSNESVLSSPKRRYSFPSRDGLYNQTSRSSPNSSSSGYLHNVTEGRMPPASLSRAEMYLDIKDLQRESDEAKVRLRTLDRTSEKLRVRLENAQTLLLEHNGVLQKMVAQCGDRSPLPVGK